MLRLNFRTLPAGQIVPNRAAPLLLGNTGFKVVQYNGRGLCLSDPSARQLAGSFLLRLADQAHVLCLQEVHGHRAEILSQFSLWLPRWTLYPSSTFRADGSENFGAGGVLIAVAPAVAARATDYSHFPIVPGRCQALSIFTRDMQFNIVNFHNFGLSAAQVHAVGRHCDSLLEYDRANPMSSFSFAVGDINFIAEDEQRFKVGRPLLPSSLWRSQHSGTHANIWKSFLSKWTELAQPFPTHFCVDSLTADRKDRGWTSAPANQILHLRISCSTVGTPEDFEAARLSDHCPVAYCFSPRLPTGAPSHSIPRKVCTDPFFAENVSSLAAAVDLCEQPPAKLLPLYNSILREASRRTRDRDLVCHPDGRENLRIIVDSISRVIWRQNFRLARTLIERSTFAAQFLQVRGSQVICINPTGFEEFFCATRSAQQAQVIAQLEKKMTVTVSTNYRKQLKGRLSAARRKQSIFWSTNRTLKLSGIRVSNAIGDATILNDPTSVQDALRDYWAPVYAHHEIDREAALKLFNIYRRNNSHLFDFSNIALPDSEFFQEYIPKLRDSAPGKNGIPYSAYKANVPLSAQIFSLHTKYMSTNVQPEGLSVFNEQLIWFAPKGISAEDDFAVYREPSQLRTIFGSNTDSKIIAGAVASALTPATLAVTPTIQRGFCRGRQLSLNVVDLDSYMRAFYVCFPGPWNISNLKNLPVSALYDFCNAFPTIIHEWLFIVLIGLQVPVEFRWVIWWMYSLVTAYSSGTGDGSLLCFILSGVKTGCPASSILFLLGINPIVDMFIYLSDGPKLSATRVCADDFGSALKRLHTLKRQASIFRVAAKACGLHLKPEKCVLIFTGIEITEEFLFALRNWLKENTPELADIQVATSGKFLGWRLGVNGNQLSWKDPIEKYQSRVREIAGGKAPSTVAFIRYNQRAATVLSYVAQFSLPSVSTNLEAKEQQALHKILRLPPNCFSRDLLCRLGAFTGVQPLPLFEYCLAVSYRFAHSERKYLCSLAVQIKEIVGDNMPLAGAVTNVVPDGGHFCKPILQTLFEALAFKSEHKVLKEHAFSLPDYYPDAAWLTHPEVYSRYDFGLATIEVPETVPLNLQKAILTIFKEVRSLQDDAHLFAAKAAITLGPELSQQLFAPRNWFSELKLAMTGSKFFLRVCWLKAIGGGWTTTCRMHENIKWPCIFGCEANDEIAHYFVCPALWHIACTQTSFEESIYIRERLCFVQPSLEKLKRLALAHLVYHACKFDAEIISLLNFYVTFPDTIPPWRRVQDLAHGYSRTFKHLVT